MSLLDRIADEVTYLAENSQRIWNFAWNIEGTRKESCTLSSIIMWDSPTEERIAFKMAVKTAVVALASVALAHLVVGKVLFTGMVAIVSATSMHVVQHYKYEHADFMQQTIRAFRQS